jgi:hypothetical protein
MKKIQFCLVAVLTFFNILQAQEAPKGPPVIAEKDLTAYLFVYFTGNKIEEEAVNYAVSADGYHYHSLNSNKQF